MLIDLVRFTITPTLELHTQQLLDNYAKDDRTFEFRWSLLKDELKSLYQSAAERSLERPTLVIMPVLEDDLGPSFAEPHRRVAELAEQIGFRALDATPSLLAFDPKVERFRAAPNDGHLNELGNAIIADILIKIIKLFRSVKEAPLSGT